MNQKPRTLPKMFGRRTGDTHTSNASTNTQHTSTPDYEDTYFISESELGGSTLFDDEVIEVVEEEVNGGNSSPFRSRPQMGIARPQQMETTPPHAQTSKTQSQAIPPLPPKRDEGKDQRETGRRLPHRLGTSESNHQSPMADGKSNLESRSMGLENNHQGKPARGKDSQKVGKATKPKQKRYRSKQFTRRDRAILEAVYWMVKAPVNHIGFAVQTKPVLIQSRLRELDKRGYLRIDTTESLPTYSLTSKGLTAISRSNEKPVTAIARSTFAHRNQINTAITRFKMGDKAFQELMYEHELTRMQEHIRNNRKYQDHNDSLAIHQELIRTKPEYQRTADEERVLAKKPRSLRVIDEPVLQGHDPRPLFMNPQAAFPERLIQQSISDTGEPECVTSWKAESDAWLQSNQFPVKAVGDNTVTDADRKAMYDAVQGKEWIFRHWNLRNDFKKRHMPDGVVLMPHQQDTQGTIYPMSWWVEVETNRKSDNSEIVRVIEQAFDSPVVRGVIYMTADKYVSKAIKKAIETVTNRLAVRYRQYEGMDMSSAEAKAREFVKNNCLLVKLPALYPNQSTQFWG